MNNNATQKNSKGFQKNGWTFDCTIGYGESETDYWTKEILGHKVWKKEVLPPHYTGGKKALYHVDGAKSDTGTPVQHNSYKELIEFIKGGFQLSKVVWSDEADNGEGNHITVYYNALTN